MGFKINRVRDYSDNRLYVEIACDKNSACPDILTPRYEHMNEGKNLVSPIDAVESAVKIGAKWHLDFHDDTKSLRIVQDGQSPIVFDFHSPSDMKRASAWAQKAAGTMTKCHHCQRLLGTSRLPYEADDMPNRKFCSEACLATVYRTLFGVEPPKIVQKAKNAGKLKKPAPPTP
jgi:hypothetical protein